MDWAGISNIDPVSVSAERRGGRSTTLARTMGTFGSNVVISPDDRPCSGGDTAEAARRDVVVVVDAGGYRRKSWRA